jgi:ATPase family associated with various cellular activities (AAA)
MNPDRLVQHFQSGHRCVRVVTQEESEFIGVGVEVAMSLDLQPLIWTVTRGVRAALPAPPGQHHPVERLDNGDSPAGSMRWLAKGLSRPAFIMMLDLADHLADSVNMRSLRDLLDSLHRGDMDGSAVLGKGRSAVLLIDHTENMPPIIAACSVRHEVLAPSDAEITELIKKGLRDARQDTPIEARVSSKFLALLVQNLRGLSRRQVRAVVGEAVRRDGRLGEDDLPLVQQRKRELLRSAGVLEFVDAPTSMDEIGGLASLKQWLAKREMCFGDPSLPTPRGVLILGVQGAGKSLASKAIATAWRRPLMRLDAGSLFNKYIGEAERNLRTALQQAEAMAPVVLWIDEIEKGFASAASASHDGGVSRRMFGSLLTWMQEHRSQVFLAATANDIEALPPELLRKGRFDEIFFVDLPTPEVRGAIFRIHIKKRGYNPGAFEIAALASASEGYSGAEIEQAVVNALIDSKSIRKPMATEHVLAAVRASPPLSVTMAEKIQRLREWSVGRCVRAD